MGGDHKCPVCQATFTRPQHVARHMRSHTGDRPYKCQYCGDQFARSDLLSRHVNKCHANEKPLGGATNGRRKGTTSLSRATTSKQACDQCVQSSLPCDGSNPCTKCVQRKYRCTYVKFHRQTAPVGPGHNPAANTAPPKGEHIQSAHHHHHPASQHLSSAVLGLSNVPAVNISLGGSSLGHGGPGSVTGLSDLGLGPARFPTSSGYPGTSPVDEFYHLPPPNGYTAAPGPAGDAYSPAYTTSRMVDEDMYGPRPGTASSAGSSSTHGSSVGSVNGQWTRNVYSAAPGGGPERLEPRSLHSLSGPGGYSSSSSHPSQHRQQWSQGVPPTHQHHQHSHSGGHSVGGHGGGSYTHAGAPPHDLEDLDLNAQAQTFRDLFADEFAAPSNGNPTGAGAASGGPGGSVTSHDYATGMSSASPLIRPGDGGMSDGGGSSDGGHSVGSVPRSGGSFGRRRGFDLTKPGDPYGLQFRRSRAGSTASSSSSRPSTQHGYDSISPSPLISSQPLAPGQPGSATNPTFSNAFGSMTIEDANALASLGGLGDGRTNLPENDPDATPLGVPFQGRGSVLLGGDDTASVSSSLPSNASTSLSSASTGNTSARTDASGSLPGFSPIVRPLSSLAAYPPSSYLNQTWQQGAAQQAAMGNVSDDNLFAWGAGGGYGGTGWTPGITALSDFNFDGGSNSGSDGSSGPGGLNVPGYAGIPSGLTPTPGKEDGGKDLKEFWKLYMRTPLTGPGFDPLGAGGSGTTPGGNAIAGNNASGANAAGTPFRRPRVASMPSSNSIPRAHRDGAVAHLQQLQAQLQQQKALGPMSSIRTTLHGPLGDGSSQSNAAEGQQDVRGPHEDLSSYGAAVMARKTPVNLSLARALGRMKKQQQVAQEYSHHHRAGSTTTDGSDSPVSSRESSVGFGDDVRMEATGEHVVRPRPSVKRLASSVLESDIHKVGRFDEGVASDDSTPKANKGSDPAVVAPKPSVPFAVPDAGDGMKKSMGMFPPPAALGSGSMMPPPPSLGLGSRPPSLLERRSRMAQAQQAQSVGSTELQ